MKKLFNKFSAAILLCAIGNMTSCNKDEPSGEPQSVTENDMSKLVGNYQFSLTHRYYYWQEYPNLIDSALSKKRGIAVCVVKRVDVENDYLVKGKIVRSDSSHQLLVHWGHDTIANSGMYSPTRIHKVNGNYEFDPNVEDTYVSDDSLHFKVRVSGHDYNHFEVKGKKLK